MLRPSRPMIRPFMSSLASSTTVTVVSAVWLAATRCSASATSARARRRDSVRASSSICPHRPRELVPDEVLRALEHGGLGLAERHPRDPLELLQRLHHATPSGLPAAASGAPPGRRSPAHDGSPRWTLWSISDSRCAMRSSTFAISTRRSCTSPLGVGPEAHGELARLDLCLATDGFASRSASATMRFRSSSLRRTPDELDALSHAPAGDPTDPEPDDQGDQREHVHSSRRVGHPQPRRRRGRPHPSFPRAGGAFQL